MLMAVCSMRKMVWAPAHCHAQIWQAALCETWR